MRILHVNTDELYGGAARAALRLHEALLQNGIDSRMLVASKKSDINSVITSTGKGSIVNRLIYKYYRIVFRKNELIKYKKTISKKWGPFSPQAVSNKRLIKSINEIKPDIVHMHWICSDFLSIEDIAKINAPVAWSLHDMWPFTGGCHYVAELGLPHSGERMQRCGGAGVMCDKYTKDCGGCDFLGSKKKKDLSFRVLQRKKRAFGTISGMAIIGLSRWMKGCAKESSVFKDKNVVCLPNPINASVFKPFDKMQARLLWNLPTDKKLILFGAIEATSTLYKGYDLLIDALNKLSAKNVDFAVFGSSKPANVPELPNKIHYLGHLGDTISLVSLYNACDVIVVPSKRENLSNTIMESLSCGKPVVCFNIGGNSDMVGHKSNGYLVQPFDTSDLAKGIDWVLDYENYDELSKNAREKVVAEFDYAVVAKKYVNLYEEIAKQTSV